MSSDTPAILIAFLPKPVVAKELRVEVVRFIRRVVNVELGSLVEEETMVIDLLTAAIQAEKRCYVDIVLVVNDLNGIISVTILLGYESTGTYITRDEIETRCVELE